MVMLALRSYSYYTLLYLHYLYRTVPTLQYYRGRRGCMVPVKGGIREFLVLLVLVVGY